ncbi:preprotein translocase subunit YajC [Ventosimonas gracilis]|uniref:Sec translocon accessory complex subunit YajC n=1 Tax=Ventosimonas gracilis TaxID=1680762 RepID=A0A139SUV1_9GAMM|nr:preprotein translocase subunit YajC [Ventosimonas gracilis]KXU38388.1 preprotein translocase subunit YajC [Ventosimonas gracilis]
MSFLIPQAFADTTASVPADAAMGGGSFQFIFLLGFVAIFYFMIWRPQAKRSKEHKALIGGLQKGDEVVTAAGIAGKVSKVTDDFVLVEVADKVELKFQKSAIAATLPKGTLKAI